MRNIGERMKKMDEVPWKQERFKQLSTAKLAREGVKDDHRFYGVHIYKGHRHWVLRYKEREFEQEKSNA